MKGCQSCESCFGVGKESVEVVRAGTLATGRSDPATTSVAVSNDLSSCISRRVIASTVLTTSSCGGLDCFEMANRNHGNARNQRVAVVDMTDIDIPSDELDLPAQETAEVAEEEEVEDDGEADGDEEVQGSGSF